MRDFIRFHLNGQPVTVRGDKVFMTLSDFLRDERRLTGTKVVCAEGDCGACTTLSASPLGHRAGELTSLNSCIAFVFQMDGRELLTVESLARGRELHPCQKSMVDSFGAQCGFCTPGFVGSLAYLAERAKIESFAITEKKARNYTTGNLCRCTGYQPILEAACKMDLSAEPLLSERYDLKGRRSENLALLKESARVQGDGRELLLPSSLEEACEFRRAFPDARVVAGATDLGVLHNKRKIEWTRVMSLQNIAELHEVTLQPDFVSVGARVTLTQFEDALGDVFPDFARLLHIFASPQIKNAATLVGNILNASPIADGTPFLLAAGARLVTAGKTSRKVPLASLYTGYKTLSLRPDELVSSVEIPRLDGRVFLAKASVRKDLDISVVTMASCFDVRERRIHEISLAVGGVGPTVALHADVADLLRGKEWTLENFRAAAALLRRSIQPISDVRGGSEYRRLVAGNFLLKMYYEEGEKLGLVRREGVTL